MYGKLFLIKQSREGLHIYRIAIRIKNQNPFRDEIFIEKKLTK
jgi:hypothetical protein